MDGKMDGREKKRGRTREGSNMGNKRNAERRRRIWQEMIIKVIEREATSISE